MSQKMTKRKQIVLELVAEVLLSFLPMVIVLTVLVWKGQSEKLFLKPEWAFGAAIFFGQMLVRLVSATATNHGPLRSGFLAFLVALVVLVGIAPACSLVALIVYNGGSDVAGSLTLPFFVPVTQVILYLVSAIFYVVAGVAAREFETRHIPSD